MPLSRDELCALWPRLKRPLELIAQWECPRGLIFESDPASALEAVTSMAALLGGHVEKFERHPVLKADWQERAGRQLDGAIPRGALLDAKRNRLVVIVLDLDRQPEWLQLSIKRPIDISDSPFRKVCFLTTAEDARKIPDYVRSHLYVVRKNGRRRGPLKSRTTAGNKRPASRSQPARSRR